MKLKKIAICTAVAAILCAGCSNETADVDVKELSKQLTTQIKYEDELTEISEEDIENYIEMETDVEGIMYMSSGSTAEEVAVFTAPDSSTADKMKENVQVFLDDQKSSFEDYIPEEAKRVEDAVVFASDNYVVLCVSGDSNKATEIIDEAFGK